jgi:NADH:ubiquinone oxidoreductase subunit B-like Fe-S oxidoreductase
MGNCNGVCTRDGGLVSFVFRSTGIDQFVIPVDVYTAGCLRDRKTFNALITIHEKINKTKRVIFRPNLKYNNECKRNLRIQFFA